MEKDFNTGPRRSLEADRIKLTLRRKQLLREMGLSEDLDSTELAEKLHEQVRANDALNRNLIRSDEEIAQNRKEIAQYKAENTSLRERIAELESKLAKGIAKHRDYIFTFLTNPAVPPTNNDSEKALRPAKTKLKVSGCFRTKLAHVRSCTPANHSRCTKREHHCFPLRHAGSFASLRAFQLKSK